ncbi:trypsin, alkaline A-like isoform X3 [Manduca sexta]|uniref:trypsin, alkaline A-like isoform X3 n=1 Tax=Manduca sexta TaxID=7130 RepID=UPI00188EEAB1|nr:trypsin, alkaline A-like isoform X3 [Manduca sexta]
MHLFANMRTLIALLALGISAVVAVPANPQRIVGGSTTTINSYPSIVALLYSSNLSQWRQTCGGTIINNRSIVTAAHCPHGDSTNRWRVRVGSTNANSGGRVINSQRFIIHGSYNRRTLNNDIAIIRLAATIIFSPTARAVNFAGPNYNLRDGQAVWAAGWGRTSTNGASSAQLRHVQIWTVNQATCRSRYASIGRTVTDNMLCAGWLNVGGRDQCQGDSGGPLYHNRVLVGVCSWGEGCGLARFPGVNVRVSRYANWIRNNA